MLIGGNLLSKALKISSFESRYKNAVEMFLFLAEIKKLNYNASRWNFFQVMNTFSTQKFKWKTIFDTFWIGYLSGVSNLLCYYLCPSHFWGF